MSYIDYIKKRLNNDLKEAMSFLHESTFALLPMIIICTLLIFFLLWNHNWLDTISFSYGILVLSAMIGSLIAQYFWSAYLAYKKKTG